MRNVCSVKLPIPALGLVIQLPDNLIKLQNYKVYTWGMRQPLVHNLQHLFCMSDHFAAFFGRLEVSIYYGQHYMD